MTGGRLDGLLASGLLLVGALRQAKGSHDLVEGVGILVDEVHELVHELLALFSLHAELLPTIIPSALVCGEVGHHSTEGSAQRSHGSGDGSTARCGTLTRGLFHEFLHGQVGQTLHGRGVFQQVFDDLLARVERL